MDEAARLPGAIHAPTDIAEEELCYHSERKQQQQRNRLQQSNPIKLGIPQLVQELINPGLIQSSQTTATTTGTIMMVMMKSMVRTYSLRLPPLVRL